MNAPTQLTVADILAQSQVEAVMDELDADLIGLAPVKDLRHAHRNRRLAGAGVAGEVHVQRRCLRLQPEGRAQLVDDEQCRDVANARLHRREADD